MTLNPSSDNQTPLSNHTTLSESCSQSRQPLMTWVSVARPHGSIDIQESWLALCDRLMQVLSVPQFKTWIAPLKCVDWSSECLTLQAESSFSRDWVLKHYQTVILAEAKALTDRFLSEITRLEITVLTEKPSENPTTAERTLVSSDTPGPLCLVTDAVPDSFQPVGDSQSSCWTPRSAKSQLNPRYTFEHCVVGQHNRFCHAAALAVAEAPAQNYNPFFIYGGVGLGKTHLMQAIGHYLLRHRPDCSVRYVTAEQFTNDLIQAIGKKALPPFRERYRDTDVLIIDDVQFLEGKERTQEEMFHTFNTLHQAGKQIILSSDRSPSLLLGLEDRLKSRFAWGLIADIQAPDLETRVAILKGKAERDKLKVPDSVLHFVAEMHPGNVRELEGALNKVAAFSMLTGVALDVATAQQVLGMKADPKQLSYVSLLSGIARYFHLTLDDLTGPSRSKDVSYARQVAIYILRTLTEASFPKIGEMLGGRKHTTVLYAYEKVKEEILLKPILQTQIQELTVRIRQGHLG